MKKRFLNSLILLGIVIFPGCTQQTQVPKDQANGGELTYQQNFPHVDLPGIDRSAFGESDGLSTLTTPIGCKMEASGPFYREQSKNLSLNNYNLIQFDLNIPIAKAKAPYYPYAYTGGDVASGDGALDAGIFADTNTTYQGSPMWMPFMNYTGTGDTTIPDPYSAQFKYGLTNSQKISVKMWTSPIDYVIRMSVSGNYVEINRSTGLPNTANPNAHYLTKNFYLKTSQPSLWQKNATVAYKLMATIAINTPGNYGYTIRQTPQDYPTSEFSFVDGTIKIGKINSKNVVSGLTNWDSLILASSTTTQNPCFAPNDISVNTGKHSARVELRAKAQIALSPLPPPPLSGYASETLTGALQIKNTGLSGSRLYYDVDTSDMGGAKITGKLLTSSNPVLVKYAIVCSSDRKL